MRRGTVYTETVVHLAPEAFQADVPYQVAIIDLGAEGRVTARIEGDRVTIGDSAEEVESPGDMPRFRRIS